jgi:hypothetical protein
VPPSAPRSEADYDHVDGPLRPSVQQQVKQPVLTSECPLNLDRLGHATREEGTVLDEEAEGQATRLPLAVRTGYTRDDLGRRRSRIRRKPRWEWRQTVNQVGS